MVLKFHNSCKDFMPTLLKCKFDFMAKSWYNIYVRERNTLKKLVGNVPRIRLMEKYYVYVIEVATGKHVLEFEVVDGQYKDEDAAKYVELMYGDNSRDYRIKINSLYTNR